VGWARPEEVSCCCCARWDCAWGKRKIPHSVTGCGVLPGVQTLQSPWKGVLVARGTQLSNPGSARQGAVQYDWNGKKITFN
jgi:hypothetical protein